MAGKAEGARPGEPMTEHDDYEKHLAGLHEIFLRETGIGKLPMLSEGCRLLAGVVQR